MVMFPLTRYNAFCKEWREGKWEGCRLGQAFHNYMKLEKVTNTKDKEFCDKLWNASNERAADLIDARIDDNC